MSAAPAPRWRRRDVVISLEHSAQAATCPGWVYAPLGAPGGITLHRRHRRDWMVSHRPTGLLVRRVLCLLDDAKVWAGRFYDENLTAWAVIDQQPFGSTASTPEISCALGQLREWSRANPLPGEGAF